MHNKILNYMHSKRDRLSIIAVMLENLVESRSLTELMYKTRLDTRTATKYLRLLTDNGLVTCLNNGNGNRRYIITEKGAKFLGLYNELIGITNLNQYIIM